MKNLFIREEFLAEFDRQLPNHRTYAEAYEATERLCEQQNGLRKYSGWDSFRQVWYRHTNKRMTKK